jgi:hypothetical protein
MLEAPWHMRSPRSVASITDRPIGIKAFAFFFQHHGCSANEWCKLHYHHEADKANRMKQADKTSNDMKNHISNHTALLRR